MLDIGKLLVYSALTMTNTLITDLIAKASENLGKEAGRNSLGVMLYVDAGSAKVETEHGLIECFVSTTDQHRERKRHIKTTFKLSGKVVSRSSLEKILSGKMQFVEACFKCGWLATTGPHTTCSRETVRLYYEK